MDAAGALEVLYSSDAQLAALSVRYRGVVHGADSDFARFPDVRWHNPLQEH